MLTPRLRLRKMRLRVSYVSKLLGVELRAEEIKDLLERMRYAAEVLSEEELEVIVPPYRVDVLHPIDLVEDVAIAYGYDKFEPVLPSAGVGEELREERFFSQLRELMIGYGFQEVFTLILTNPTNLFERMLLEPQPAVEAKNPVSAELCVARSWLLPSLLVFLSKNKHREYPQLIFEIGDCIDANGRDEKRLAAAIASSSANFSQMKRIFLGLHELLSLPYAVEELRHPSFIEGRCASSAFGFFGEVHPQVLENFKLEMPVAALELRLNEVLRWIQRRSSS